MVVESNQCRGVESRPGGPVLNQRSHRIGRDAIFRWERHCLWTLILAQSVVVVWGAFHNSPTRDEPAHLQAGLTILHLGRFEVYTVNPPLVKVWAAIPGFLVGQRPVTEEAIYVPASRWGIAAGTMLFRRDRGAAMSTLVAGRLMMLPVLWLGDWLVLRWGRRIGGRPGGVVALGLWCLNPMVLGHAALVTPDLAAAVAGLAAIGRLEAWWRQPDPWTATAGGIATAVAMLTKFTWVPVLPVALLAIGSVALAFGGCRASLSMRLGSGVYGFVLTLGIINAAYAFDGSMIPLGQIPLVSDGWAAVDKLEVANRWSGRPLGRVPVPLPRCYVQGIDVQRRDFQPGRMGLSFLAGRWAERGWWHYYVVAAVVREPLPTLALGALGFGSVIAAAIGTRRPRRLAGSLPTLAIPAAVLWLLVSSQTGFNHYYRYVLPAMPLAVLAVVAALRSGQWLVRRRRWLPIALVAAQGFTVASTFPHFLSYFNAIAMATGGSTAWLSDGNVDWGQDLLRLRDAQRRDPAVGPLHVIVPGIVDPRDLGINVAVPPYPDGPWGKRWATFEADRVATNDRGDLMLPAGWYAVSDLLPQGCRFRWFDPVMGRTMNDIAPTAFESVRPHSRVGGTLSLYHLSFPMRFTTLE